MQDSEVFGLFLHECEQQIDEVDSLLLSAESGGRFSEDTIDRLFRLVHTLKGTAAMMGYTALAQVTHQGENVLQEVRRRELAAQNTSAALWKEIIGRGFDFTAYYRETFDQLKRGEEAKDSPALREKLSALLAALYGESARPGLEAARVAEEPAVSAQRPEDFESFTRCRVYLQPCAMTALRAFLIYRAVQGVSERCYTAPAGLREHPELDMQIQREGFELGWMPKPGVEEQHVRSLIARQPLFDRLEPLSAPRPKGEAAALVSVSQARVNTLIDQMNEVLRARAALEQYLRDTGCCDRQAERLLRTLARWGTEVAGGLGALGMTEIGTLFLRMRRLARELLVQSGKQADVVVSGGELTLDKSVLEAVNEMLLHVVRNAVDHGIEPEEERVAAGKPARGTIRLDAKRRNGRLWISVSDDGRGVDGKRVLAVAREKGLLKKPEAAYTRQEIFSFLLLTGFSTKAEVTETSGRGVGMDAVQHMAKKIGGRMQITSDEGRGSQILFDLPLTLTTVDALRVQGARACYVPVSAVERVVASCDAAEDGGVLRIGRTRYAPLLPQWDAGGGGFVVLFCVEQGRYYLRCREIGEYGACLIKPLPSVLKRLLGGKNPYSGCVQDALGGVYLLLNVEGLAAAQAGVDRAES